MSRLALARCRGRPSGWASGWTRGANHFWLGCSPHPRNVFFTDISSLTARPWPLQAPPRHRRADLSPPATSATSTTRSRSPSASSIHSPRSPPLPSPGSPAAELLFLPHLRHGRRWVSMQTAARRPQHLRLSSTRRARLVAGARCGQEWTVAVAAAHSRRLTLFLLHATYRRRQQL